MAKRRVVAGVLGQKLGDHPRGVTWTLVALVLLHALLTWRGIVPNVWQTVTSRTTPLGPALYLGLATVSSLAASAAGMVITLGLSNRTDTFRTFRLVARDHLKATWVSILSNAVAAAGIGLIAAALDTLGVVVVAPWAFELGLVLVAHSGIRMIALLRRMMQVVAGEDRVAEQAANQDRGRASL